MKRNDNGAFAALQLLSQTWLKHACIAHLNESCAGFPMAIAGFHAVFPHARGRRGIRCPQVTVTKVLRSRGAGLRLFTQPQVLDASAVRIQGGVGHPGKGVRTV